MSIKYCGKCFDGYHICGNREMGNDMASQCDGCAQESTYELDQAAQIKLLRDALEWAVDYTPFSGCPENQAAKALAATEGK